MRKVYIRLFFTCISLLTAVVMIATVSYAWLVLSGSPSVNGISVLIGGGQSILLAPDLTQEVEVDGQKVTVHYPGKFSNTLDFSKYETYNYLNEVSALSPVSSADGHYWLIPQYDEDGNLAEQFAVDDSLSHGNQTSGGGYVYVDYWLVSPGSEYDVRVSMDEKHGRGSYLVELPPVEKAEDGSLQLADSQNVTAASARVGFLVNTDKESTADMTAYTKSKAYQKAYTKLLGVYQKAGEAYDPADPVMTKNRFTIYEPNGTLHPLNAQMEGGYQITKPLQYDPWTKETKEVDLDPSILAVQKENQWISNKVGSSRLQQMFQAAVSGKGDLTQEQAAEYFYKTYLQNQVEQNLTAAAFIRDTSALYSADTTLAYPDETLVGADTVEALETAGASDGAVITRLERNVPQRIRMYIWLEGQDGDCRSDTQAVKGAAISLKLELAGSTE